MSSNRCRIGILPLAFITFISLQAHAEDRLKLWEFAHDQCVPNQQQQGNPSPCVAVNLSNGETNGYAIFPDRNGVAQFLLIPTRRITGIEDPITLTGNLPDYWNAAWQARSYLTTKLGKPLPDDAVGLAVNAAASRSQDQLHIHIDCLAPAVIDALRQHNNEITVTWSKLNADLGGHRYNAKRVTTLDHFNPFKSLTTERDVAPKDMGQETLVLTASAAPRSFIVLEDHADPATGDRAHGEDLLDPTCAAVNLNPHEN